MMSDPVATALGTDSITVVTARPAAIARPHSETSRSAWLELWRRAIKLYLKSDAIRIAVVTKDAECLRDAILSNKPSPITYNAPKPKEITDEDKIIENYKISVKPVDVIVVPVEKVFQ
jgi:hypothetical protein